MDWVGTTQTGGRLCDRFSRKACTKCGTTLGSAALTESTTRAFSNGATFAEHLARHGVVKARGIVLVAGTGHVAVSLPDRAEPGHCRMPRISLRILLWMSRPFASRGQDLVDLAGDIALQATDDLGF